MSRTPDSEILSFGKLALLLFGKPDADCGDLELGDISVWFCKNWGLPEAREQIRHDARLILSRLTLLADAVDEIERRRDFHPGLAAAVWSAAEIGTPSAFSSLAEALEPFWHDSRLSDPQIVSLVEDTERLRVITVRMKAAGMGVLREHPQVGSNPSIQEVLVALTAHAYGELAPHQVSALKEAVDYGHRFDLDGLLQRPEANPDGLSPNAPGNPGDL